MLQARKEFDAAEEHFRAALDAHPHCDYCYHNLGMYEARASLPFPVLHASADSVVERWMRTSGNNFILQYLYDEGIQCYKRAFELNPSFHLAFSFQVRTLVPLCTRRWTSAPGN